MKKCELCAAAAAMYCESDEASLCWDCDSKVHSANFLVERHSRVLLCHVCHSPTAWTASGSKLGRTVSVCDRCVRSKEPEERAGRVCEIIHTEEEEEEDDDEDDDDDDDDDFDSDDADYDDDDEDNQVVPWTWPPPPPLSSSSSGDESSTGVRGFSSKRLRDGTVDYGSDDDFGCSSSHRDNVSFSAGDSGAVCVDSLNRLKRPRTQPDPVCAVQCGPATSIVDSLKGLYEHDVNSAHNADAVITGICEMTQITPIVGSNSNNST